MITLAVRVTLTDFATGAYPDVHQVTVEYREEDGRMVPVRVHTIVISTQHNEDVTNEKIRADLMEHVIKPVVPAKYLDANTIYHLNPSGEAFKFWSFPDKIFVSCRVFTALFWTKLARHVKS